MASWRLGLGLFALSGSLWTAPAGAERGASVEVVDRRPVTVRGTRFQPLERVSIRIEIDSAEERLVSRAGRRGAFTVASSDRADRCAAIWVFARGSEGSRASQKLPAPECPPPLRDEGPSRGA